MKKIIIAAFVLAMASITMLSVATPAYAAHCPADMKKIDAALAKQPALSKEQMGKVTGLRAKGEALHKAGQHGKSVEALAEAMKILGIH